LSVAATRAREAVEKADVLKPEVILLDIAMPRLDGLTAVPLIREKAPNAVIIIVTLYQQLTQQELWLKRGLLRMLPSLSWRATWSPLIENVHAEMKLSRPN
jgi:CheY-like chemotaxis protein